MKNNDAAAGNKALAKSGLTFIVDDSRRDAARKVAMAAGK